MISMSETEIIEALEAAKATPQRPPNALTTSELADVLGIGFHSTGVRIRAAVRAGVLECVRVYVTDITGVARPQPAYRPLAKSKKKAR